jgi:hypothetical protein
MGCKPAADTAIANPHSSKVRLDLSRVTFIRQAY